MKFRTPQKDKKSQSDKFKESARELECDEDEARWEEKLRKVVKAPTGSDKRMPDFSDPKLQNKTFTDGYLDGWCSVKSGSNPPIPAHAIPAGKTAYQHGYELGKKAAE